MSTKLALELALLAAAVVVFTGPAGANEPDSGEHTPFFDSLDVNVASLEVVALDAQKHRVTDLDRDEFRLYEDGRQVPIDYFYRVSGSGTVPATTLAGAAAAAEPLHVVIYVDDFSGRRSRTRAPFTYDLVVLTDDAIDLPDRVKGQFVLSPVARQVRVGRTVDRLLDAARHTPEGRRRIQLATVVGELAALLRHQLPADVTLAVDVAEDLHASLPEDGFRQALLNLILNAAQASLPPSRATPSAASAASARSTWTCR